VSNKTVTTFSLTKNKWRFKIDATLKRIEKWIKTSMEVIDI